MVKNRSRRVITYDLSAASTRAAFEGDHDFELDDSIQDSIRNPQTQHRLLKQRNERAGVDVFGAEDYDGSRDQQELSPADQAHVLNLIELFGSLHSPEAIQSVFRSCEHSFDAALQVLSDMGSTLDASTPSGLNEAGSSISYPMEGYVGPDGLAGALGGMGLDATAQVTLGGTCWWDLLHESVREAVLSHLSARDLARVAWTCRDFAWRVRNGRINARSLVIPTGVTLSSILGMVAGHPNARAISLVRWGASMLRDADFNALIGAIAHGSCSSRRNVRVEAISLRGWTSATDSNLLTLLESLQDLRELDLSDCGTITDAAMGPISRYQRPIPDDGDDEPVRSPTPWGLPVWSTAVPSTTAPSATTSTLPATVATAPSPSAAAAAPAVSMLRGGPDPSAIPTDTGLAGGRSGPMTPLVQFPGSAIRQQRRELASSMGGLPGGSSDDESLAGGSDPGDDDGGLEDDDDDGVILDEEIAAREQAKDERKKHREATAAAARGSAAASTSRRATAPVTAGTPPLAPMSGTSPYPRFSGSGSLPRGSSLLGSSPTTAALGSLHRHGHATLLSSSPGAGGWGGGGGAGGGSPLLGQSPPVTGGGGGSSLGKGGSLGSLGKTLFGRFGGARGGAVGTPPPGGRSPGLEGMAGMGSSSTQQRGLEVLCLAGCSRIGPDGVKTLLGAPLVKQCLRALDLSRCMRLTRAALVLPPSSGLRVLKAAGCQNLQEVVMQLPLNSPLQELWVNNCKNLGRVHVVAPRLTLLHVGGCKALNNLQLRCPRLIQLLANMCCRLCDIDPEDVLAPALEELNLFGCRQLGAVGLSALVGGCPSLHILNLNGCNTLHEVALQDQLQLRTLDVTGCKALTSLRSASTALTTLTARACSRLSYIELEANTLQSMDVTNCVALRTVLMPALPAALTAMQAQVELSDVMQPRGRGAPAHPAQARVVSNAAAAARLALHTGGIAAPSVRSVGCDVLPALTAMAFRVLKAAAALPVPRVQAAAVPAEGQQVPPALPTHPAPEEPVPAAPLAGQPVPPAGQPVPQTAGDPAMPPP